MIDDSQYLKRNLKSNTANNTLQENSPGQVPSRARTTRAPTEADLRVSRRINQLRRAAGISQRDLSAMIGITSPQMYRYENGLARISTGRLLRIADALKVDTSTLLGDGTQAPPAADKHEPELTNLIDAYRFIQSAEHRAALLRLARSLAMGQVRGV